MDENYIKNHHLKYKEVLELKIVLDHYREKMSNIPSAKRLEERRLKFGMKDNSKIMELY